MVQAELDAIFINLALVFSPLLTVVYIPPPRLFIVILIIFLLDKRQLFGHALALLQ